MGVEKRYLKSFLDSADGRVVPQTLKAPEVTRRAVDITGCTPVTSWR